MLLKKEADIHKDHQLNLIPPHLKSEVEWFIIAVILTSPLILIGTLMALLFSLLA